MSVNSVSSSSTMQNSTLLSASWGSRLVQKGFGGLTDTVLTRFFMRFLGISSGSASLVSLGLATAGIISWSVAWIAFPAGTVITIAAIWYSNQFDTEKNPEELEKIRKNAQTHTLDQVAQIHGWNDLFRLGIFTPEEFQIKYRQQLKDKNLTLIMNYYEKITRHIRECVNPRFEYFVPLPSEWKAQWHKETAEKTFADIIQSYSLENLEKYSLLEIGELNRLKELKRDHDLMQTERNQKIREIEIEFNRNAASELTTYQTECSRADQLKQNHFAVRQLQEFDFRYIRERQNVQERLTQIKKEERNRFDRAIAHLTVEGKINPHKLGIKDKEIYDRQLQELERVEIQAENEARQQIAQIDSNANAEKNRLTVEIKRVEREAEKIKEDAKLRLDRETVVPSQIKENKIKPIQEAFKASQEDLNKRYCAYLNLMKK